jgi:uncharacterized protein (TIGR02118 family)
MKVLLTVRSDEDRETLREGLVAALTSFVASGGAAHAAADIRVVGDEYDTLKPFDNDPYADAVLSLWQPASRDAAVGFPLPSGTQLVGAYEIDEVVQRDYDRSWPDGVASPGVKLVCFVTRCDGVTHERYSEHWRNGHGPLALEHQPGFWHYVQNHVVDWLTDTTPRYDGIGELHFRTLDDVQTGMFDSEEGQRLIYEDTERFMDHTRSTTLPTNEYLVP